MFVLNKRQGNFVYRKKKYTLIILKIDHQNNYIITKKVIFDNNLNPSIYQRIKCIGIDFTNDVKHQNKINNII